jgi:hypothetical protein
MKNLKKLTQRRKVNLLFLKEFFLRLGVFGVLLRALTCVEKNDFLRGHQV